MLTLKILKPLAFAASFFTLGLTTDLIIDYVKVDKSITEKSKEAIASRYAADDRGPMLKQLNSMKLRQVDFAGLRCSEFKIDNSFEFGRNFYACFRSDGKQYSVGDF